MSSIDCTHFLSQSLLPLLPRFALGAVCQVLAGGLVRDLASLGKRIERCDTLPYSDSLTISTSS